MGAGSGAGEGRAVEAAGKAMSSQVLDGVSMKGAKGVIISITGGEDMRLMEVDEAASHIKELVDPDANIIWGSAFNNDLGGKIRVSVVATAIEADSVAQPTPGKVFTFPARQPVATPAPAAPAAGTADPDDTLEVDLSADEEDELLLGTDDILTSPVGSAPIAPPQDDDDSAQPAAAGGTLFERMSNIARGAPKAQIDEDETGSRREPIDIPRFLNRQNNQ
jgi:cell division protein FtsZ